MEKGGSQYLTEGKKSAQKKSDLISCPTPRRRISSSGFRQLVEKGRGHLVYTGRKSRGISL